MNESNFDRMARQAEDECVTLSIEYDDPSKNGPFRLGDQVRLVVKEGK